MKKRLEDWRFGYWIGAGQAYISVDYPERGDWTWPSEATRPYKIGYVVGGIAAKLHIPIRYLR